MVEQRRMRRFIAWMQIVMGFALASLATLACATPVPDPHGTAGINGLVAEPARALLWKVERMGLRPSYIYATMHAEDPRATDVSPIVLQAFQESDSYTMELVPEPDTLRAMTQAMFLPEDQSLRALMGEPGFARTAALLEDYHVPAHVTDRLCPWAVIVALNMPKAETGAFLDVLLYSAAVHQGKVVHGLETVGEQLSPFQELTLSDQVDLLRQTVLNYDAIAQRVEGLVAEYWAGDLAAIGTLSGKFPTADPRFTRLFKGRLIDDRNQRMVQRLLPRIEEQNSFIVIGAEHLPGDVGILHLLEQRGYRVSPVY